MCRVFLARKDAVHAGVVEIEELCSCNVSSETMSRVHVEQVEIFRHAVLAGTLSRGAKLAVN